ncbi:MAG: Flp pilus assembly complex ATPase component TadA [Phycisphaerae bacterium]|nr:Flp pilus assembly complex ATPase component TadA [Phycisphaerae bacterium]
MRLPFLFQKDKPLSSGPLGEDGLGPVAGCEDLDVRGLSDLYTPDVERAPVSRIRDIADALLETKKITEAVYGRLRHQQTLEPGCDAGSWLVKEKAVDPMDLQVAKAAFYGLEFQRVETGDVDHTAFEKLPFDFIRRSGILPVKIEGATLIVATPEPGNVFGIEDAKRQTQMEVRVVVCGPEDVENACHALQEEESDVNLDDILSDMTEVEVVQDEAEESEDLEKMAGRSPVIKLVNYLISNAIREGASDIHIEPKEKICRIRYRIDGALFEAKQAPIKMHPAIVSRIKIMANLDISERRLPQDGKVSAIVGGRAVDLRISTLPTNHGEKTVIRILDSRSIIRGLEQLGMEPGTCRTFREQIDRPHGIFLVTGPTGSGKSTTLYTALRHMDGDKLNISTVEDPVEYQLDFCNQIQVNEKIGLTFAGALRSLLRQDPDIVMVGEIRDNETARIAVQAALTGHLVLSTLHTNDAPSSITRLVNIGIDAYLIAASLNAVLAQRLVRKICPACKEPFKVPEAMLPLISKVGLQPEQILHGAGCAQCRGSGYSGRLGIYELLVVDDRLREMINSDASVAAMRRAFCEGGGATLFDDGMEKVRQGVTTLEEILRVTQVYGQNEQEDFAENR